MQTLPISAALLALTLCLAGCVDDSGRYPSLDQRPIERAVAQEVTPPPPEAAAAPTAGLVPKLRSVLNEAQSAHAQFLDLLPGVRRRAAAAGPIGSDSWADGQVAFASLVSARSDTMFALADLDVMLVAQAADANAAGADVEQIVPIRNQVEALIAAEDAALQEVSALLR